MVVFNTVVGTLSGELFGMLPGAEASDKATFVSLLVKAPHPELAEAQVSVKCQDDREHIVINGQWDNVSKIHNLLVDWMQEYAPKFTSKKESATDNFSLRTPDPQVDRTLTGSVVKPDLLDVDAPDIGHIVGEEGTNAPMVPAFDSMNVSNDRLPSPSHADLDDDLGSLPSPIRADLSGDDTRDLISQPNDPLLTVQSTPASSKQTESVADLKDVPTESENSAPAEKTPQVKTEAETGLSAEDTAELISDMSLFPADDPSYVDDDSSGSDIIPFPYRTRPRPKPRGRPRRKSRVPVKRKSQPARKTRSTSNTNENETETEKKESLARFPSYRPYKSRKGMNTSRSIAEEMGIDLIGEDLGMSHEDMKRHISYEEGTGYKCNLCDRSTISEKNTLEHIARLHGEKRFKCRLCKKAYGLRRDLQMHVFVHKKRFQCDTCSKMFATRYLMLGHKRRRHENPSVRKNKSVKEEGGPSAYACKQCSYVTGKLRNLKDHEQRIHGEKNLTCPVCDKCYAVQKELKQHMRTHTDIFQCEWCGRILKSKYAWKLHVDIQHKGIPRKMPIKTHLCTLCGKMFPNKTKYAIHQNKEHLNIKPYSCTKCNMSFYAKANLKDHLKVHEDRRDFSCEICGKSFKMRQNLKMHLITHSERRPYSCEVCDKQFTQNSALRRHVRIHTGERPFVCHLCSASFNDYSILTRHMQGIHKIENYKFDRTSNWVTLPDPKDKDGNPQQIAPPPQPKIKEKCVICNKTFANLTGLTRHMRMIHENPHDAMSRDPSLTPMANVSGDMLMERSHEAAKALSYLPFMTRQPQTLADPACKAASALNHLALDLATSAAQVIGPNPMEQMRPNSTEVLSQQHHENGMEHHHHPTPTGTPHLHSPRPDLQQQQQQQHMHQEEVHPMPPIAHMSRDNPGLGVFPAEMLPAFPNVSGADDLANRHWSGQMTQTLAYAMNAVYPNPQHGTLPGPSAPHYPH